jgi:HEPN domain-containing protein
MAFEMRVSLRSWTKVEFRRGRVMGPEEKYQFWFNDAQYDLAVAGSMFTSGHWLYSIFMCQQSIEKLTKGLYGLYVDFNTIPFTHNIGFLIGRINDKLPVPIPQETWELFETLSRYYVNKRYPDYKKSMYHKATKPEALRLLNLSKEVFAWLQTLKPSEPKPEDMPQRPRP